MLYKYLFVIDLWWDCLWHKLRKKTASEQKPHWIAIAHQSQSLQPTSIIVVGTMQQLFQYDLAGFIPHEDALQLIEAVTIRSISICYLVSAPCDAYTTDCQNQLSTPSHLVKTIYCRNKVLSIIGKCETWNSASQHISLMARLLGYRFIWILQLKSECQTHTHIHQIPAIPGTALPLASYCEIRPTNLR